MFTSKKQTETSPGATFEYGEAVGRIAIEECKGDIRAIRGYVFGAVDEASRIVDKRELSEVLREMAQALDEQTESRTFSFTMKKRAMDFSD